METNKFPPIQELPNNNSIMRLLGVGPVTRAAGLYTEPMWEACFKREHSTPLIVHLAAPLLTFLPLASLWKAQALHDPYGGEELKQVKINASNQAIFWRPHKDSYHFFDQNSPGAIPYILFSSSDEPYEVILVRCTEVIRFYFGASGLLTRFIFDFVNGASQNDALFFRDLTGFSDDGSFVIAPSKNLRSDKEAHFIAKQLAHEPSRKSLALISSSARSLHIEKGRVWPVAAVPIEGPSNWKVIGKQNDVYICEDGFQPQATVAFGVASIFECSAFVEYPEIQILRPPTQKRPPTKMDALLIPVAKGISKKPSIKSTEAGNVPLVLEMRPMQDISESRPAVKDKPPKVVQSIEDHESGKIIRLAPVLDNIEEVSALQGTGVDEYAGSFGVVPGGTDPNKEWKKTDRQESEPVDRSSLPSLFEPFALDLPKIIATPKATTPPEFLPLIEAAKMMVQEAQNEWAINIADELIANLPENLTYLYDLPETWGPEVHYSKSPTTRRRALILRFESADIEAAVLDIEPRQTSEFAVYAILTRHPYSLTSDLIAKIIHWRLFKRGAEECWPTRETHSGPFWAGKFNHSYISEANKRMRNKIFSHLGEFSKTAHINNGTDS